MNQESQAMFPTSIKVIAAMLVCLVCFTVGRIWDEVHDRRTEQEKLVQVKKDFKLFEQENGIILRTVLQDLQALDKEFKTVELKEKNTLPIRVIELKIDDLFSDAPTDNPYKEQFENSTRFEDFDLYMKKYKRQTLRIQREIQEVFTKTPPAFFHQKGETSGINISPSHTRPTSSDRIAYLETVTGTNTAFSKMFPRLYALQLKNNFNLNMIPGTEKTAYSSNGSQLVWVHFDREILLKSPSTIRNFITSLRLTVTYNVDEQKLDIKFDYHGLPI